MRTRLMLSLALILSAGCQAHLPNTTKTPTKRPVAVADVQRLVAQNGVVTELTGKAHIISDNGLGIISNNSGGIISDNGSGIISDNGLGIISDNGLGYRTLATGPRQESLLADAKIEVLDAQGRLLVDASKKPLGTTTDKKGNYTFTGSLPAENLVLRVRLWNGGILYAMLVYDPAGGARTLDIGTASTLGAQYVLEKFVQKRKDVYDRLPVAENDKLQAAMESARALLTGKAPTYKPADMLKAAEDLKAKDSALSQRLDAIEAIMLAGQKNLGTGLPATQVSLGFPLGVVGDDKGQLFILESSAGRLRRVNTDGTAAVETSDGLGIARTIIPARDGNGFIIACTMQALVRRYANGKLTELAGTGVEDHDGAVSENPAETSIIRPDSLAYAPDGTLYIGEAQKGIKEHSRLFALSPAGKLSQVDVESVRKERLEFAGLAVMADGTLYATDGGNGRLLRKRPNAAWEVVVDNLGPSEYMRLSLDNDGKLLLADTDGDRIARLSADDQLVTIVGTGTPGYTGDGGPATAAQLNEPAGTWMDKAGTLYVVDAGNGVVRAVGTDGRIRTVAGVNGQSTQGDALTIAIGSPTGFAFDPQGRMVIAESTGNTIKRLENGKLTVIAGADKGFGGDGGPATAAQLNAPLGLAFDKSGNLFFVDGANYRVRKIDTNGVISTVAGSAERGVTHASGAPAFGKVFSRPLSLVLDPDGQPIVSDNASNQLLRVNKNGTVDLLAGRSDGNEGDSGDDGPAAQAELSLPSMMAYDKAGNLVFCDTGNLRVRRISPDGTISTVAGVDKTTAIGKLLTGKPDEAGAKAKDIVLLGPCGLCFDADGNMYVAEAGTESLTSLGGSKLGPLASALPRIGARIRKITPDGTVTTIAGQGSQALADKDGDNSLNRPVGLLIDAQGRLVICDGGNNQIKMLPKGSF